MREQKGSKYDSYSHMTLASKDVLDIPPVQKLGQTNRQANIHDRNHCLLNTRTKKLVSFIVVSIKQLIFMRASLPFDITLFLEGCGYYWNRFLKHACN